MPIARLLIAAAAAFIVPSVTFASPLAFSKLAGLTGGTLAATGVYQASLSGLGNIVSITIQDNSVGLGGAAGQFTGFDLDAIVLSTTNCADAACVKALSGLPVFDYTTGTVFLPGGQRPPPNPKLFGTGPTGTTVDNTVATLGAFDGEATTAIPGAFGFISLGDNGVLTFNLTGPVSTTGLYLYIGEVGDNGEVVNSAVTVAVPEPATLALLGLGLAGLAAPRRRKPN